MKFRGSNAESRSPAAFSLMEAMIGMAVIGVLFVALYSGLTYGYSRVKMSRENLRATQILVEKMETIRLYNWDQINKNNFIPKEFEATYYPAGQTTSRGVVYNGKLEIEDCVLDTNYEDQMKRVVVTLTWKTGKLERERSLTTYVTQYGLHSHIY